MQPLLADIGDVIGVLIFIAMVGFSVLSKILSANDGKGKPAPPRQRPPNQPGAGQPPPVAQRPGQQRVEAEIADFLRQARGGGQAPPQPPAGPAGGPPRVVEAVPIEAVPVAEVVPGQGFGSKLAAHVDAHIGRDSISGRDAHLGDFLEAADERSEHHLRSVFDHDVGRLAHADSLDTSVADGTDAADSKEEKKKTISAAAIAEMLKTPESIRTAFVISEILKRPEI